MKIELRIEDGAPIIIFPGETNNEKMLTVWTAKDGHSTASRAYVRRLRKPETREEIAVVHAALRRYFSQ